MGKLSKGEIFNFVGTVCQKVGEHLEDEETPDELDVGEIADIVMTAVEEVKEALSD